MATHYTCDICNSLMKSSDHARLMVRSGRLSIEVLTAIDGVWNGGQVCHSCIRRAFTIKQKKTRNQ